MKLTIDVPDIGEFYKYEKAAKEKTENLKKIYRTAISQCAKGEISESSLLDIFMEHIALINKEKIDLERAFLHYQAKLDKINKALL